jgi:hypothetical protein
LPHLRARQVLFAGSGRGRSIRETKSERVSYRCEIEVLLSLAPGHRIAVSDHGTGEFWRGSVDVTFPEHGFIWVFTDLGERKLLDVAIHTIWRLDLLWACGDERGDACSS